MINFNDVTEVIGIASDVTQLLQHQQANLVQNVLSVEIQAKGIKVLKIFVYFLQ